MPHPHHPLLVPPFLHLRPGLTMHCPRDWGLGHLFPVAGVVPGLLPGHKAVGALKLYLLPSLNPGGLGGCPPVFLTEQIRLPETFWQHDFSQGGGVSTLVFHVEM